MLVLVVCCARFKIDRLVAIKINKKLRFVYFGRLMIEGMRKEDCMKRIAALLILTVATAASCGALTTVTQVQGEAVSDAGITPAPATAVQETPAPVVEDEPEEIPITYKTDGVEEFLRPDLIPYIEEVSAQYGVKAELVEAMIETESKGQATATCGSCQGLMQVSRRWHKDRMDRLGVTDLYDERGNILVGVDVLCAYHDQYGDDLYLVLGKYNGQSDCAEGVPNEYAQVIIDRAAELEQLHDYHMSISVRENIVHSTGGIK